MALLEILLDYIAQDKSGKQTMLRVILVVIGMLLILALIGYVIQK